VPAGHAIGCGGMSLHPICWHRPASATRALRSPRPAVCRPSGAVADSRYAPGPGIRS